MVLGPAHGALLAALDMLLACRRLAVRPMLYFFNISNHAISVFTAGKVYQILVTYLAARQAGGFGQSLLQFTVPVVGLALTHYVVHLSLLATMAKLANGTSLGSQVSQAVLWELLTYLAGATAWALID